MNNAIKSIGLYFFAFFFGVSSSLFIVTYLVLLNPILEKMPQQLSNIFVWILVTWGLFIPIATGLTIGLIDKKKELKR